MATSSAFSRSSSARKFALAAVIAAGAGFACARPGIAPSPAAAVQELLAADRSFGTEARARDGVAALAAMFDDSIVLPAQLGFADGKDAAVAALRENPQNAASRLEWSPVRGGVSADGQHGFTFGFMTQRVGDSTHTVKYLAYWVKRDEGWRVLTYRRRRAAQGPRRTAMMEPSLPAAWTALSRDAGVVAAHRASLAAAEQRFSDSAQVVGLQAAFESFGLPDAINLGGPGASDFIVGSAAIGRAVGAGSAGQPSPVSWSADHGVVVASSGDLGVTFGYIRPNATDARRPSGGSPFFTIWRRASPSAPWRYVAE